MTLVLFTMLTQSIHSFRHLHKLFAEKECAHRYNGKTEISHQHHPFDRCFTCDFIFSSYTPSEDFNYWLIDNNNFPTCFAFNQKVILLPFRGSFFILRGPPIV